MMTPDMDLRTAPPRRSAGTTVLDPRLDGSFRGSPSLSTPRPARRATPGPAGRPTARPTSASPAPPPGARSSAPRRLSVGVLAGALTMFVVALLDTVTGAQVPVLGSFAALPVPVGQEQVVDAAPPPTTPGTCLAWTHADASDTRVVDCGQTHLFEQAGTIQLSDQKELPDDSGWRQLVRERCDPVVREYLGGRFDPDGRYRVGALKPSPAKWNAGDRELRCGLQSASRSGALYPMTGRAADQDQAAVHDTGTCLAIDGRTIGDPVDCARSHAVETVGVVDLAAKFDPDRTGKAFPAVDAQDEFLQTQCTKIATSYAGGDEVITGKKLTVYWDNLTEESWKAGSRRVNCNLAALLPDRSGFAPVTGSVRGPVTVGETAAPPATDTPEPGVPVAVPPPAGPPATPAPSTPTPGASATATPPPAKDGPPQEETSTAKPEPKPEPAPPADATPPVQAPDIPTPPVTATLPAPPPDLAGTLRGATAPLR